MLPIHGLRRAGVASVATGPVAREPEAVIPAPGVLYDVATHGARVTDLGARNHTGRLRDQPESLLNDGIALYFGEGGHGPELDAFRRLTDPMKLGDPREVDHS